MKFLQTFRARLLVVLALLLVLSLGVQYYLNYTVQIESAENRELREQALVAGIGLGFSALTQTDPLEKFVLERGVRFLDEDLRSRIDDIILIDPSWQVYDSLSQQRAPEKTSANETILKKLSDLTELPPPKEGLRLGEDLQKFPNHNAPQVDVFEGESHAVPLETNQGRYYVMVILKDERDAAAARAVHAHGMDFVDIGQRVVLFREVADRVDRGDIAIHRIDGFERDQLRRARRRGFQQRF